VRVWVHRTTLYAGAVGALRLRADAAQAFRSDKIRIGVGMTYKQK